ncbi:MAG TPA: hypothetical protein PLQ34_07750 [Ferrovaceae bacterium]|nr:hypothetical protein [Ferrovaceae bacterium]
MGKPHKHAALIKAWADGAEIQYKNAELEWKDFPKGYVTWDERTEYRIKPKELRLEAGKFYKMSNGEKARIYATDGSVPYKIHGAIQKAKEEWVVLSWTDTGKCYLAIETTHDIIGEWEDE